MGEDGKVVLTTELVGIWDILSYLPIWPSYFLPIQVQPFSHAVFAGPICTVLVAAAAQQSLRIQGGLWEFFNNALSLNPDMRAWLGTMFQAIENSGQVSTALKTPLYVVRTGLLTDTSPLYVKTVRMSTVAQLITEITPAYGVDVRVSLWRPGDPQPDAWANLTHPTYVMTVRDRSQIEGPTKTILDSALRFVVDVQGSLLGKTLEPLLNPQNEYVPDGLHIAPALGVDFVLPYAVLVTPDYIVSDGEVVRDRSPLITYEIVRNTPLGWQHVIGGKSPVGAPPGNWWGTDRNDNQNGSTTFSTLSSHSSSTRHKSSWDSRASHQTCWTASSTTRSSRSNSSSITGGATMSARTIRPSKCSHPRTPAPTTSRHSSSSSRCSGRHGDSRRRRPVSVGRTGRTNWAATSSPAHS